MGSGGSKDTSDSKANSKKADTPKNESVKKAQPKTERQRSVKQSAPETQRGAKDSYKGNPGNTKQNKGSAADKGKQQKEQQNQKQGKGLQQGKGKGQHNGKAGDPKSSPSKGQGPNMPPVKERGYKKLIRVKLRDATIGHDMEYLEHAIDVFERNQLEDDDDLADAYDRLEFLHMKKDIRDAILRRHPTILDKAIAEVESSSHKSELQHYLDKAKEEKENLKNLDNYRHEISTMDQKAISEVRSYHSPPEGVREALMSTYLLLGYSEARVSDWQEVRAMLGRQGKSHVLKEIEKFDKSTVSTETSDKVKDLMSKFTLDEVRAVSSGAASFYLWIEVPLKEDGYPAPKPPSLRKSEIYDPEKFIDVDKHALRTPMEAANTYEELMVYLVKPFRTDLQQLRAIFVWLSIQDLGPMNHATATDVDTPTGYMRLIGEQKGSYAAFLALLCRKAKLPCVIIPGVSKSVGYEVGAQDVTGLRNKWNAVYVSHSWRIIHPLWACRSVQGHKSGNWTLVESGGTGVRQQETAAAGTEIKTFNEYYFLTDPQEFVYFCFPDAPQWQLVNKPFTMDKFISVPYLRQGYFKHGLRVSSKFECINRDEDGICTVQIKVPEKTSFQMTYDLFFNHNESTEKLSSSLQLDRYVLMNQDSTRWNFMTRFPVNGVYKITIFGNVVGEKNLQWLADFKLICDNATENCQPYPANPPIGFGPGYTAEVMGLRNPSHKSGLVAIRSHQESNFTFNLTKKLLLKTELVHNTIPKKDLKTYLTQTVKNNRVDIGVNVPHDGEYALKVYAKEDKKGKDFENVCNYMLTTEESKKKKKKSYENAFERKVRRHLIDTTHKRDPTELQIAMDKFLKTNLDDNGDFGKAGNKLEFLNIEKALKDAINRRHVDTLVKAISLAQSSRYSDNVTTLLQEAEAVLAHLRQLDRFAHEVLEMKQTTISEIHSYKKPQPIIFDVMQATFLLLGEKDYNVDEWENIQTLMRRTGKNSMIRKVKQFDSVHLNEATTRKASKILDRYNDVVVRNASAGAGTFFVWNNVPTNVNNYAAPKVPKVSVGLVEHDYEEIDRNARLAPKRCLKKYSNLTKYISEIATSDLETARCLLVWMSAQRIRTRLYSPKVKVKENTPLAYMEDIHEGRGTFAAFYALLCRAANIPCVIIKGVCRTMTFDPGKKDIKHCTGSWNAIKIDDSWKLVHPFWSCTPMANTSGGDWVLVEEGTKGTDHGDKKEFEDNFFDSFFFAIDPMIMIKWCYPHDRRWQILHPRISYSEFLDQPFLRPSFFQSKFSLVSEESCVLNSIDGSCEVRFHGPKGQGKHLFLSYELHRSNDSLEQGWNSSVFSGRCGDRWNFQIRFPLVGNFKFSVYAFLQTGPTIWMCDFVLVCSEAKSDYIPLPIDPGQVGWGPGPITEEVGLLLPSQENALVSVRAKTQHAITFFLLRKLEIETKLISKHLSPADLGDCVKHLINRKELEVKVFVPEYGEYALMLYVHGEDGIEFRNVCNYLLTAEDPRKMFRRRESGLQRLARERLKRATESEEIDGLRDAVSRCEKEKIGEYDDDMERAKKRMALLKMKKDLRDAVMRRHYTTLERTISFARDSAFEKILEPYILHAEDIRDEMKNVGTNYSAPLSLKQTTISELRNYRLVRQEVHTTMSAAFLLLGERPSYLEKWTNIQTLLRKQNNDNVLYKIQNFTLGETEDRVVKLADKYLSNVDENRIKAASSGAASFYIWTRKMIDEFNKSRRKKKEMVDKEDGGIEKDEAETNEVKPSKSPKRRKEKSDMQDNPKVYAAKNHCKRWQVAVTNRR
ncbi:hypothetical protein ScPMuIL_018796 [Solemya velum]